MEFEIDYTAEPVTSFNDLSIPKVFLLNNVIHVKTSDTEAMHMETGETIKVAQQLVTPIFINAMQFNNEID